MLMGKRRIDVEVVPESDYTDFSDRNKKDSLSVVSTALLGTGLAATASISTYLLTRKTATVPSYTEVLPVIEPINVLSAAPDIIPVSTITPDILQTGIVADSSLNMLATVLDPLIQILVAISFPIASVIMIGACFFFMLGQSEKAWTTIFNAGLGYVLIQMSPLFLDILRTVGKSI